MAAPDIAFETPDTAGGMSHCGEPPVDLAHLDRQTMGDRALGLEVLEMFAGQARASLKELAALEGEARAALAHRLKGSARAVGANGVGAAAEALEENPADAAALAGVAAAVVSAEDFIRTLCR